MLLFNDFLSKTYELLNEVAFAVDGERFELSAVEITVEFDLTVQTRDRRTLQDD